VKVVGEVRDSITWYGEEYRASFSEVPACCGLVLLFKFSMKMKALGWYQRVT